MSCSRANESGPSLTCSIMFVPATSQMTFKYYNPKTKQASWKSVNVGSFKLDGRGCKSDHFVRSFANVPFCSIRADQVARHS